jgi:excisionase family DNA binding protein
MLDQVSQALPTSLHGQPPYLTVRQASRVLCVSSWVLYQAIRLGQLPVIRWGRRVVLDREDLAAYVESKRDSGLVQQVSESRRVQRHASTRRITTGT